MPFTQFLGSAVIVLLIVRALWAGVPYCYGLFWRTLIEIERECGPMIQELAHLKGLRKQGASPLLLQTLDRDKLWSAGGGK